jgi:hypothetical protein
MNRAIILTVLTGIVLTATLETALAQAAEAFSAAEGLAPMRWAAVEAG